MIRRWLPSSSTKRRISDFLKHRTSLHDTAARQQLTVNCSSRGYARMIEAHADPRSEALWAGGPKRGGGAQKTDATRRERELRGELVRCKIVPYVDASGGAARTCVRARRRPFGARHRTVAPDRPATAFRLAAHDHRNKRMILWKYYICLRQCRSIPRSRCARDLSPVTH
jgi:hypothetical protein